MGQRGIDELVELHTAIRESLTELYPDMLQRQYPCFGISARAMCVIPLRTSARLTACPIYTLPSDQKACGTQ